MRIGDWGAACCLFLLGAQLSGNAAELKDCVKLVVSANGDATLSNACSERLNVTYCVDNPKSAKNCASGSLGVTTLWPGSADLMPSYIDQGAGSVYWAVCVYPEAAIDWKPGADNPYGCRKTCVMC